MLKTPLLLIPLLLTLAQSPQPETVCVQFRGLDEIHWSAGVFTVNELPSAPEDPSMWFLWTERERSLHVFRDKQWTKVEKSDYAWSLKSCSEPPWYVPVSQRLREQRWAEKTKGFHER
jgi:hypothetical protein